MFMSKYIIQLTFSVYMTELWEVASNQFASDWLFDKIIIMHFTPHFTPASNFISFCFHNPGLNINIAVFSEKTDVPHLPNQSMVAISVMKL